MQYSRRHVLRGLGAAAAAAAAPSVDARIVGTIRGPAPIRLSLNESAYGPSASALAVLRAADAAAASRYPDVECDALRAKIAQAHRVSGDRVAIGAGAGALLQAIAGIVASPARSIVAATPMGHAIVAAARSASAPIVAVPLAHDWSHDLAAMRRHITESVGLVYLCNPHNPTGSLTRRAALDAFLHAVPPTACVVVDETYHDFVGASPEDESLLAGTANRAPLVVLRSFSKAFGLAGARVGYAIAEPATARRIDAESARALTAVGALAAVAALDDRDHLAQVVSRVADDRQEFYNQANARMLRTIDSHANFVMLNALRPAAPIVAHFARNGISLPAPFDPLGEYIRVSLGTDADMAEFWRVWDLTAPAHAG
jgi:histidinol-phosphate aminotransferase